MKFARYLGETQVPEWKRAYVDYRGLKKRIAACRREQDRANSKRPASPQLDNRAVTTSSRTPPTLQPDSPPDPARDCPSNEQVHESTSSAVSPALQPTFQRAKEQDSQPRQSLQEEPQEEPHESVREDHMKDHGDLVDSSRPDLARSNTLNMGMLPKMRRRAYRLPASLRRGAAGRWELNGSGRIPYDPNIPVTLAELMPLLTSTEKAFFHKLDREVDKVEVFYAEREREMSERTKALKAQLTELQAHREEYHEIHPGHSWMNALVIRPKAKIAEILRLPRQRRGPLREISARSEPEPANQVSGSSDLESPTSDLVTAPEGPSSESNKPSTSLKRSGKQKRTLKTRASVPRVDHGLIEHDIEEYYHVKRKLKKAVLECYRGLEILNNYLTLNIMGFRKALKKFEKVTKIPCQQAYTMERLENNSFMSSKAVHRMIQDLEELYATHFTYGDRKKALARLRGGALRSHSHHLSTLRSGFMFGVAIPALVDGLVRSFQADTRQAIPAWDGLLYTYGILFVPVFFSLMVGLNLQVWSAARINYVFIFELEIRTKLDHRQFYELPAFFMFTLCYAFWFSFKRIGENSIHPTTWPLLWLALFAAVMFNPLPICFRHARFWLIKNVLRLFLSGTQTVDFTEFWLGDQFCSLVFSLSNLYFIPCAYNGGLDVNWQSCTSRKNHVWGVPFLLAILPFLARTGQSIKRWYGSRLFTHIVNAGKYATGMIYYLSYFVWRHDGGGRGQSFVAWCIFGALYASYAASWDILMDWSLAKPHARYPLLRSELMYNNAIPVYYFALVTNVLIRFAWVFYIPENGPNYLIRVFIVAMLESLRRWQWNFFRLENEHLGNMDQYRVTREVPLPYALYDAGFTDDEDVRPSSKDRLSGKSPARSLSKVKNSFASAQEDQENDEDDLSG